MNKVGQNILQVFSQKFTTPCKLYFSPGRINFIGEHIDYNDGYVLPAAIDKGIYFALAKNNSSVINIYAADFDEMLSVDCNEIQPISGWKNYVLSILNQFKNLNKNIEGFNCVFSGDIPSG
ncbi:MAG: galactokinase, partial [Ferruginibacter sp.]|nr:galactokinase [Ferruginibacter sp.]